MGEKKPPLNMEPQAVQTVIKRWDVFWTSMQLVSRLKIFWVFGLFGVLLSLYRQWVSEFSPVYALQWAYVIVGYAVIWSLILMVVFLVASGASVLQAASTKGVIGTHVYEIREKGLFEKTETYETLCQWSLFSKVISTNQYLFLPLSWAQFHVFPRRCFPDSKSYHEFAQALEHHIALAKGRSPSV